MCSSLLTSVKAIESQTTEVYSSLDLTRVKCNIYRHSRDEKEEVTLQTRKKQHNKSNSNIDGDDNNSVLYLFTC
jgi:hypothetical protein